MAKKKKLYRRIPYLPFSLTLIRGAIGKEFVIKHYSYGAIRTRYPDMTRIIASAKQRKCRNLFKEAVEYAKQVIADPVEKAAWQKRLRKRNGVFNAAVKFYMLKEKREKERALMMTNTLLWLAFKNATAQEMAEEQRGYRNQQSSPLPVVYSHTGSWVMNRGGEEHPPPS